MDDLKKLSVERLRALARKHLGKGHSRLRTRAQLLEALKDVLREPLSRLLDVAESVVPGKSRVKVVEFPPGNRGRARPERTPPAPPGGAGASPAAAASAAGPRKAGESAAGAGGPGEERGRTRRPGGRATPARNGPEPRTRRRRAGPAGATPVRTPQVLPVAEPPVEDAFFETPAVPRRPRRAPSPPEPLDAGAFALPREAGTDAPVLLVRDPSTLFVFWDFRRELERGAALGLREPRLLLRLYRGDHLDRTLELPLGARSTYVTGLGPGQEYTAEVLLLGRDGWTRPVGSRSTPRRLPPGRVSRQLEVRTLRLPWSEPLGRVPPPSAAAAPRHEPLDSPRRVPLPTSPGGRRDRGGGGPTSGGPRSGRN